MRIPPSQNDTFGFFGSVITFLETWADAGSATAKQVWDAVFPKVATALKLTPEKTRFLLDSKLGRWMFDDMTNTLPSVGSDESKKTRLTVADFVKAAAKVYTQKWFLKEVPTQLAAMDESVDDGSAVLAEDIGDLAFYGNFGDFVRRAKGKTGFASDAVVSGVTAAIQKVFSSSKFMQDYRQAVLKNIRADKALLAAITRDGFQINEAEQMDDITQAVFETTEDGELPFHGELIVEGEDGQSVTLDEADVMEDVVIEAFEAAISEAVASDPNAHAAALREIDEALAEGDYETAMEHGCALLAQCGVDEAQIDEFKKGFKTSATQRQRMGRARMKAKTGTQLMALRARRRAARKGSSRMKRQRYYKSNKRRISRRRAQLQNSVNLDANMVAEMAEQGLRFVVVVEGDEPVFASTRKIAESLAGADGVVIELTDEQIEEACAKAGGKRKGKAKGNPFAKKDEPVDEKMASDDEEDEEDEESDDEDDYEDGEEDDDEADESVDETQLDEQSAAAVANEIAKFIKANPRVGYGEIATRFKVGRDVAQQAVIIAGNVAGASGDKGSWLWLAKEIMGKLMKHTAGTQTPANPTSTSLPRKNHRVSQVASVQDDGADLQEDDLDEAGTQGTKPKVVISAGNKAGTTKVSQQALPKAQLKGKTGSIKSAHGRGESVEDVTDQDDDLDEVQDKNGGSQTHRMGKGKGTTPKAGPSKLHKPAKVTNEDDEEADAGDSEPELVEVSAPTSKAEALVAAAAQHGLDSNTKVRVQTKEGTVSMFVPASLADSIRKAIA